MSEHHPEPDLDYLKRVLLEMLAIPSPTGFTDTIVRYVAERLDEQLVELLRVGRRRLGRDRTTGDEGRR
jgi:putative aminopeptidase FrvX